MPRRVTGRGLEPDLARDLMIDCDEVEEVAIGDRLHGVDKRRRAVQRAMLPFIARDEIARVWKRRLPFAVDEHRVPTDVIGMQMRTHDGVDRLARKAGGGEVVEKRAIAEMPRREVALLVIADAGIDGDRAP